MITPIVQRWREHRDSYRPAGEPIVTSDYSVEAIASDNVARGFVVAHHYSGSYPAARRRFGLYTRSELVGVAVFSQPSNDATMACLGPAAGDSVELGRLVLLDDVPSNGESWFVARCFEHLKRDGFAGVVSFSDPVPRETAAGKLVHKGHLGTVYQASNAVFLGRARAENIRLLPDASVLHNRALAKLRKRDKGWRYVAARLEQLGASPLQASDDVDAWLHVWLPRLVRVVPHSGNFKYAFALDKRTRKTLPVSLPYPKMIDQRRSAASRQLTWSWAS